MNEKYILNIFIKLLEETGNLYKNVVLFPSEYIPEERLIVDKKGDTWISYIKERGEKTRYSEFNDLYSLCLDTFESLDKESTDYCMDMFVPMIENNIDKESKQRKR